jgi:hypothetical protein
MPTVLKDLLNARANTRKQIKQLKKQDKSNMTPEEIEQLNVLITVLDKRQLAYKVSANSGYGATGVQRGYLPCMPVAMTTTAMGRKNIQIVADVIPKKYGGILVYGDTDCVQHDCPVLLEHTDDNTRTICYKTVEELSDGKWTRINPNKEISQAKPGYKIWSDQGFTDIVNVVRCGIKKPLSRVLTHVGEVICSNEHSLLRENLECVTPLDIKLKDKLCISELPLPKDTPDKPLYNNKLTEVTLQDYKIPSVKWNNLSAELAFVWGVFFADGSCGKYTQKIKYTVSIWAINKKDIKLLERCMDILNREEIAMEFKILDTVKSSHVYKLVAKQHSRKIEHEGDITRFVEKYRTLFYNERKLKKVPDIILNAPLDIRQSFFMGYYAGDGSKKDPALTMTNKGAIGSAGLFYLLRSIGYNVSINTRKDKLDTYKLTSSTPDKKQRKTPNAVKKITPIEGEKDNYIYDIQTGNHHFAAGVGQLVIHNSNYVKFPHITDPTELWDYCLKVSDEVSAIFPENIILEFEDAIFTRYLILSKKRYMSLACDRDGTLEMNKDGTKKIKKKGVLLTSRDNCDYVRNLYADITMKIFDKVPRDDILYSIIQSINSLCSGRIDCKDFITTKAVGNCGSKDSKGNLQPSAPFSDEKSNIRVMLGNYKVPPLSTEQTKREHQFKLKDCNDANTYYTRCLPAQVQLAEKMRRRGQIVDVGSRIEYVITDPTNVNGKQYEKIEDIDYYKKHSDIVKLDYFYYLKSLVNPIDQILNCVYDKKDDNKYKFNRHFMKQQYDFCLKIRQPVIEQIKNRNRPKLIFPKKTKENKTKEKKTKEKKTKEKKTKENVVEDNSYDSIIVIEDSDEEPDKDIVKSKIQKSKAQKNREHQEMLLYNMMSRLSKK